MRALHRAGDARARLDEAFSTLAELKLDPGASITPGSEVAEALIALADHEAAQGNVARAITITQQLLDQVIATGPKVATNLADANALSQLYAALAALQGRAKLTDEASATDDRRVEIWKPWDRALPGNAFIARQLASIGPSGR